MNQPNSRFNQPQNTRQPTHKEAVGHERPLASMKKHGDEVVLFMGNEHVSGVIAGFDKFSISLLHKNCEFPITYFKHAIDGFGKAADVSNR